MALPADGPVVRSVSCPTTTSCLAVGTDAEAGISTTRTRQIANRWGGHSWRPIAPAPAPAPAPASSLPFLQTVSCPPVADPTVAGIIFVIHTSGTAFHVTVQPDAQQWGGAGRADEVLPRPAHTSEIDINSIGCSAGRACAAVGDMVGGRRGAVTHPLVEHWDGRLWRDQVGTHPGAILDGVSCVASDTCTTVGVRVDGAGGLNVVGLKEQTWAERTGGHRWMVETTPTGSQELQALQAVTCTATDGVAVATTSAGALIEMRAGAA